MGDAERRWADALAEWAIPDEILAQATADPWKLSPGLVTPPDRTQPPPDTPARRRALEVLPERGTVLDVGVGSGGASLPLAPPAAQVIGVDEGDDMLAAFTCRAAEQGVAAEAIHGRWPDVAGSVPEADVVVSNHVFYNVPDLGPFALALTSKARRRVVVEISRRHPVAASNPLWKHFWGLDRPEGPTSDDALAVLTEVGLRPESEIDVRPAWVRDPHDEHWGVFLTRRLCLPPERLPDVREALAAFPPPTTREAVTVWWDGAATG